MASKFLLYVEPDRSGRTLTAWVRNGSQTTRHRIPYQPSFLVAPLHRPLRDVEALLQADKRVHTMRRTTRTLWLKGHPQEVLEVTPHRFTDLEPLGTDIRRRLGCLNYELYNVDLQPASRYLHEHALFPFARIRFEDGGLVADDDRWKVPYEVPDLRTWRLAVKPDGSHDHTTPLGSIVIDDTTIHAAGREREALLELADRIRTEDPDVFFTQGGDLWDIPYLLARILACGLRDQVNLGRLPDPHRAAQKERSFHTYGRIVYRGEGWFLRGRLHIDLAKKFLPDSEPRQNLHGLIYLARTSNTDPQRLARNSPGSCIQQAQIDRAREEGVEIPWKRNLVERLKPLSVLCEVDRGGQIHVPDPGLYEDAWSCDYSGYYPSLIVAHNLSSETINCDCCPDSDKHVPGTDWHICIRRDGHQARTLRPFVEHRRYAKALLRRSDASPESRAWAAAVKDELKAIGVVCFGYARYKHARFGCAEVHQAIQALGRAGMTRAKVLAEEAGFERLHTLTDGMIIRRRGATRSEVEALCRRIARASDVPMEVDADYHWVMLLPSKGTPGTGVPNRYYGLRRDGTFKVRGIELRRHNTPPWLARAQKSMLDQLKSARTARQVWRRLDHAIQAARDALREMDTAPLEDFAITVTATREVEDYTQQTHTQLALQQLREAGFPVHAGQGVSYVVLRGRLDGAAGARVMALELADAAKPFQAERPRPDRDHYTRLLARSMETILAPLGMTEAHAAALLGGGGRGHQAVLQLQA